MKLWLIKIGKAYATIRREGMVQGGKRVLASFRALFRRVGEGDVLFITGGLGDSARYRATHVGEMLTNVGLRCSVTVQDNPFLKRYIGRFSLFVFHRTLYTPSIASFIDRIKQTGKEIIFETDDLVYDKAFLEHMDIIRNMNAFERKQYENGVGGEILVDPYVTVCTTTTTFLANKLAEKNKRVFVVPNQLSQEDVSTAKSLLGVEKLNENKITIGYFSGTKSHDKDFAVCASALTDILAAYPNVQLFLAGPLAVGTEFTPYADRIIRGEFVDRKKHFANIARCDITIAPLEMGNPFCESKSELKFFEAGIVGVPTVASATQTFVEAIEDGVDGFVASDKAAWFDRLSQLVTRGDLRRTMGEKAREKVTTKYTTAIFAADYVDYLRSRLSER